MKFNFKFTKEELDVIFNSLADQPFKLVQELIANISNQFSIQITTLEESNKTV